MSIIFEKSKFNIFTNKVSYKNYIKINSTQSVFWYLKYYNFVNCNFVVDLVCYENKNILMNRNLYLECYDYYNDSYISISNSLCGSNSTTYKNLV